MTARHLVDTARQRGHDRLVLRLNTRAGKVGTYDYPLGFWNVHPDDSHLDDFAVTADAPPTAIFDFMFIDMDLLANDALLAEYDVGVGDELFLTGLFANHWGQSRNLPIVRVGNIASMPEEPVAVQMGHLDAYLVEARSIGGLSGCPVFVNLGLMRFPSGTALLSTRPEGKEDPHTLLLRGMMHGHYQIASAQTDGATEDGLNDEAINMGIAIIVVPSQRLRDILDVLSAS